MLKSIALKRVIHLKREPPHPLATKTGWKISSATNIHIFLRNLCMAQNSCTSGSSSGHCFISLDIYYFFFYPLLFPPPQHTHSKLFYFYIIYLGHFPPLSFVCIYDFYIGTIALLLSYIHPFPCLMFCSLFSLALSLQHSLSLSATLTVISHPLYFLPSNSQNCPSSPSAVGKKTSLELSSDLQRKISVLQ